MPELPPCDDGKIVQIVPSPLAQPVPTAETATPFVLGQRPELDGLRAVAVLYVMLVHTFLPFTGGGFVGVDLFFVLSGFLITTLLLDEQAKGGVRLSHFYVRRTLRLTPALLVLVGGVLLLSLVASPMAAGRLRAESLLSALYLTDVAVASGYADLAGDFVLLGHTWSLSIEEHFYWFVPALFVGLMRSRGSATSKLRTVAVVFAGLMLAGMFARSVLTLTGASAVRIYAGPDARCEALFAGCLFAALLRMGWLRVDAAQLVRWRWLAIASVAVLLPVATYFGPMNPSKWWGLFGYPLAWATGLCVVGYALCRPQSCDGRLLRSRPLGFVGKISYGLYLYHWPVMVVLHKQADLSPAAYVALSFALSFAAATASWYLVERPVLGLRHRFQGNRTANPNAMANEARREAGVREADATLVPDAAEPTRPTIAAA